MKGLPRQTSLELRRKHPPNPPKARGNIRRCCVKRWCQSDKITPWLWTKNFWGITFSSVYRIPPSKVIRGNSYCLTHLYTLLFEDAFNIMFDYPFGYSPLSFPRTSFRKSPQIVGNNLKMSSVFFLKNSLKRLFVDPGVTIIASQVIRGNSSGGDFFRGNFFFRLPYQRG